MEGEFKPSKEAFLIKLLWFLSPVVFMVIVYLMGLPLPPPWNQAIIIGVLFITARAVWLHGQTLKTNNRGLVIADLFRQTYSYDWRLIQSPRLEISNFLFFPRLVFTFKYHEGGKVEYQLSELSPADQEKAVRIIKNYLPTIISFDSNHPE